jgi:type VI secretion system protein VasJ
MDLFLLGKEPIRPDQPAGTDVRYDPDFEGLQTEVGKMSSPGGTSSVNWDNVVKTATEILLEKSKDILVASYLAVGLVYTRKLEGFDAGSTIVLDLLEHFWNNLYPPLNKMRGRIMAIDWWAEKSAAAVKFIEQPALDPEQRLRLLDRIEKIGQVVRTNCEEMPSLGPIIEAINSLSAPSQSADESAAARKPSQQPSGEVTGRTTIQQERDAARTSIAAEFTSPQEALRALNSAIGVMQRIASFLWQQDLANPLVFRLDRLSLWLTVENLPPATDGRTRIPPPSTQIKETLQNMRNKGEFEALLKFAEEKLTQYIFWLDLNRLTAEALSALGGKFHPAMAVVCQETLSFQQRLPGIEMLSFSDGTPFADPDTRQWLQGLLPGDKGVSQEPVRYFEPKVSGQPDDTVQKEIDEMRELVKQKKDSEVIERIQLRIRGSLSGGERLRWRLILSQLFLKAKNPYILISQMDQVLNDVDTFRLDEYDPPFAIQCLRAAWQVFTSQPDQTSKEKAEEIVHRIARIDMTELARLGKI